MIIPSGVEDRERVRDRLQGIRVTDPTVRGNADSAEPVEAPAQSLLCRTSCVVFVRDPVPDAGVQRGRDDRDARRAVPCRACTDGLVQASLPTVSFAITRMCGSLEFMSVPFVKSTVPTKETGGASERPVSAMRAS